MIENTTASLIARQVKNAEQAIQSNRNALAEMMAFACWTSEDLAKRVNSLAQAEGGLLFWARLQYGVQCLLDQGTEPGQTDIDVLTAGILLSGPDDRWSGRTNDVKRAYHDGILESAQAARFFV